MKAAARAMIPVGGNEEETAGILGLPIEIIQEAEKFKNKDIFVYPDNINPVIVFSDMFTQWRIGAKGRSGLDYGVLPVVLRMRKIKRIEEEEVFDCIKIMEREALEIFMEQAE